MDHLDDLRELGGYTYHDLNSEGTSERARGIDRHTVRLFADGVYPSLSSRGFGNPRHYISPRYLHGYGRGRYKKRFFGAFARKIQRAFRSRR